MTRWLCFAILFLSATGSVAAHAKPFQNSYLRFELPDNWNCNQEGVSWVCAPINGMEAREALIISTAKLSGPEDNLKAFDAYLRKPKTLISNSKSSLSQPVSVDRKKIGDQEW